MTNKIFITIILSFLIFFFTAKVNAQMMGGSYQNQTVTQQDILNEQAEQDAGAKIYQALQSGQAACGILTDDDFDKLGDYYMWQNLGQDTQRHFLVDEQITNMMGDDGNTNMHIILGKRASGCFPNTQVPSNTPGFMQQMMGGTSTNQDQNLNNNQGGENNMMWGYGAGNYSGLGAGFGVLGFLTWVVVLIDLILLGFWLFKRIKK